MLDRKQKKGPGYRDFFQTSHHCSICPAKKHKTISNISKFQFQKSENPQTHSKNIPTGQVWVQ